MYRLVIASHYLWHRPVIWISMLGVTLGLGSIVVVDSIFNGILQEQQRVIRGTKSDVLIQLPALVMDGTRVDPAEAGESLRKSLLELDGVEAAAFRVLRFALLPTDKVLPNVLGLGSLTRGPALHVHGIVLEQENSVSSFRDHLAAVGPDLAVRDLDRPFARGDIPAGSWPIVLGEELSKVLELEVGDTIELMTYPDVAEMGLDDNVEPILGSFVLNGTFKTGSYEVDLGHAYVDVADLREFARVLLTSQIAVKKRPGVDEVELRDTIRARFGTLLYPSDVQTWKDTVHIFMGAVENQRTILGVVLFFIVVVAGFNLLVALYMIIADKIKDIGTLASMGAPASGIASIFVSLGMLLSIVGASVGITLGSWVAANINAVHDLIVGVLGIPPIFTEDVYGFREIPSVLDPTWMLMYCTIALVSSLLFTLLASWRASRLDPIECLRREQ
jgi:lipoprotein-releasing system permease protein